MPHVGVPGDRDRAVRGPRVARGSVGSKVMPDTKYAFAVDGYAFAVGVYAFAMGVYAFAVDGAGGGR